MMDQSGFHKMSGFCKDMSCCDVQEEFQKHVLGATNTKATWDV